MSAVELSTLRRRFVAMTFLRWLPVGLFIPVGVLLLTARGMSLPTVGAMFAAYGVTTLLLELPTGSLADVIGRRSVLTASAASTAIAMVVFAFGRSVPVLVTAMVISGVGRALDSGPLEAWYVDAVHLQDREADLKPGLSNSAAASAIALGAGSLLGGALAAVATLPDKGNAVLLSYSLPYLAAAAFGILHLLSVLRWVTEVPRNRASWSLRSVARDVPLTIRTGTRLASRNGVLRRLAARSAALGVVLTAVEVLTPVQFAASIGAHGYSVLVTLAFAGTAVGAKLGPMLARRIGSSSGGVAFATMLTGCGVAVLTLPRWWAAALGYIALYVALGVDDALVGDLLHAETGPEQRATVLSVQSLLLMTGGVLGNLVVPAIAAAISRDAAWLVVSAVALLASLLFVGTKPTRARGKPARRRFPGRTRPPVARSGRLDPLSHQPR